MPAHFFCKTGEFAGSSFEITNEAVIGRNQDNIRLPADVVSGTHARIYFDDARKCYFIEDLGSRNGTKLDGVPVTDPVKLGALHVVTIADQIDFIYHESATATAPKPVTRREAEHTQPAGVVPPTLPPVTPPAGADDTGHQTQFAPAYNPGAPPPSPPQGGSTPPAGEDSGTRTQFSPAFTPTPKLGGDEKQQDLTIRTEAFGSGPLPSATEPPASDQDVQHTHIGPAYTPTPKLPGVGGQAGGQPAPAATPVSYSLQITKGGRGETHRLMEGENIVGRAANCSVVLDDTSVSRQHAAMTVRNGKVMLQDMGSRNHTFLNGNRVISPVEVVPGAVVRFGQEIEATLKRG